MTADLILKAQSVITMDEGQPRAEAIAIDTSTGRITAIGSLADVQEASSGVAVTDLGETILMPGFIDPHSHPILAGLTTQAPAHWIAPYMGYATYQDVTALWKQLDSSTPAGQPLVFMGLDRLLHGAPELANTDLDVFFPSRQAVVLDNSGHEVYFNSAVIAGNSWPDDKPPADPVGSRFGRNADGTSNGRAYETGASAIACGRVLLEATPHPLLSVASWYELVTKAGITSTTEHTFQVSLLKAYVALGSAANNPLRIAMYHMATDPTCVDPLPLLVDESRMWKQGIKLWADGSPWVGTLAASFPYLDTPEVERAQIPRGPGGESMMNYTRIQLDEVLNHVAGKGWQLAFHVNGDVGLDVVLDAYEAALVKHHLLGTDHRWRVEHCGAARGDQFNRAASLGVTISLLPTQFIFWGDLLDGTMFAPEIGSRWISAGDAFRSGAKVSFHNDGPVSPPNPLLNAQSMVTRRTPSGTLHGPEQAISIDDALRAITVNPAFQIGRDHDLGTLAVGKLADLVELSADPYAVDSEKLTEHVKVRGTWLGGHRVDIGAFIQQVKSIDPSEHQELHTTVHSAHRC